MLFSNKIGTNICLSFFVFISALSLSAEPKKKKTPEVIANVVEVNDGHLVVRTTKGKVVTKKISLDENSKIIYVGFDGEKQEIKVNSTLRANVQDGIVISAYLTPPLDKQLLEPTPEMLTMTKIELFQFADLNKNGRISYVELTEKIKAHAPKHGAALFHKKLDIDKSGALSQQEFEVAIGTTLWWKMSRKTPEEMFKAADKDNNQILSKEEFAILKGSDAHLDIILKRADKNKSGDVDLDEAKVYINELIYPSQKGLEQEQ